MPTFQGELVGIFIAERRGVELRRVDEVQAVAGRGLEADRYFQKTGTWTQHGGADRQVTLIEQEALEALAHDYDLRLDPHQTRRNLLTHGVPLNHLVVQEFAIGEVLVRGVELCEPCQYLESLTVPGVEQALRHRGGLRAEILTSGTLRVGDSIEPTDSSV